MSQVADSDPDARSVRVACARDLDRLDAQMQLGFADLELVCDLLFVIWNFHPLWDFLLIALRVSYRTIPKR
jgi:hypothetical protein